MASACGFLSEDQFLCSICLDVFTEPVSTSCGHNFCKACITKYWDKNDQCYCPMCKQQFAETPDLFVNTLISEMATQFRKSVDIKASNSGSSHHQEGVGEVGIPCDICSGTKLKALKSCLVCLASYCETHLEPHQRVPALKRHKLISPVQNLEDRICETHDKILELFCKNDQICICIMCTEHKGHDTVPLEEEYEEKMVQLEKKGTEVKEMVQERQQKFEQMKASVQSKRKDKDDVKAKCVEIFTDLVADILKHQDELIGVIDENHTAAEKQDEGLIKELEDEITELQRRSTELELLSHTEDHLQLLRNFPSLSSSLHTKNWSDTTVCTGLYVEALKTAVAQVEMVLAINMSTVIKHIQVVKQDLSKFLEKVELRRIPQQLVVDVTSYCSEAHTEAIPLNRHQLKWRNLIVDETDYDVPVERDEVEYTLKYSKRIPKRWRSRRIVIPDCDE